MIAAREVQQYTGEDDAMVPVQMVRLVVDMTIEEAQTAAAHMRERTAAGGDILADPAKSIARPVMAALVDAGVGA